MKKLLTVIFLAACLTGCGYRPSANQQKVMTEVANMVTTYNAQNGTHYPQPNITFLQSDLPDIVGDADYGTWTLQFNASWVEQKPCWILKEGVPHEVAHLFVEYDQYGPPRTAYVEGPNGSVPVTFNGPKPLTDDATLHNDKWRAMAAKLGANPCKEGYCPDPHPYSTSNPPPCP